MTTSVKTPEVFNGFYFKAARFGKNHLDLLKISMLVTLCWWPGKRPL